MAVGRNYGLLVLSTVTRRTQSSCFCTEDVTRVEVTSTLVKFFETAPVFPTNRTGAELALSSTPTVRSSPRPPGLSASPCCEQPLCYRCLLTWPTP